MFLVKALSLVHNVLFLVETQFSRILIYIFFFKFELVLKKICETWTKTKGFVALKCFF